MRGYTLAWCLTHWSAGTHAWDHAAVYLWLTKKNHQDKISTILSPSAAVLLGDQSGNCVSLSTDQDRFVGPLYLWALSKISLGPGNRPVSSSTEKGNLCVNSELITCSNQASEHSVKLTDPEWSMFATYHTIPTSQGSSTVHRHHSNTTIYITLSID